LDEKNEEAETGTTPSPETITANTRMNNRRIDIQSTKFSSCNLHLIRFAFLVYKECDRNHKVMWALSRPICTEHARFCAWSGYGNSVPWLSWRCW